MFIDSFSGSLDDIPRKYHGDMAHVLVILKKYPKFSMFDINSITLARTVDKLNDFGYMTYNHEYEFPWCKVDITTKGNEFLDASSPQSSMTDQTNE